MRLRRGHTLAEALCALALSGVLAAAAGSMLGGARRALESAEDRERGGRAEREAVAVVRKAMSSGGAILLRGDTAVELDLLIGTSVLCEADVRALLLPPARVAGALPLSIVPQLPTADDLVAVRRLDAALHDEWWYAVIDSVAERQLSARCAVADGWRAAGDSAALLLRVVVSDTVPTDLEAGAEVRLMRRGRFALYHAGSGEWVMGWRRCHPWSGACGVIQPVAGPLVTPSAGGLRLRAYTSPDRWEIAARGVGGRGAAAVLPW